MAHEKVYGVCEDQCFVEVHSKNKVDELLTGKASVIHNHDEEYIQKENIKIVTGSVDIIGGIINANVAYPSGFTAANCVVISTGLINDSPDYDYDFNASETLQIGARLKSSAINVRGKITDTTRCITNFKVVLLKVN